MSNNAVFYLALAIASAIMLTLLGYEVWRDWPRPTAKHRMNGSLDGCSVEYIAARIRAQEELNRHAAEDVLA